jgi:hypothetical protein
VQEKDLSALKKIGKILAETALKKKMEVPQN